MHVSLLSIKMSRLTFRARRKDTKFRTVNFPFLSSVNITFYSSFVALRSKPIEVLREMPKNTKRVEESGSSSDKKRGRSPAKEENLLNTQKKRNISQGNPKVPTYEQVRSWLSDASEGELDRLSA